MILCVCRFLAISLLFLSPVWGQMVVGDIIVIDFSKTSEPTAGNWNNVGDGGNGYWGTETGDDPDPIAGAGDLVRFSDGSVTGVSLGVTVTQTSGIGGLTVQLSDGSATFTGVGTIPFSAQTDAGFAYRPTVFTFSGLDDSLTYNLEFQSWVSTDASRNSNEVIVQDGYGWEQSITIDPNNSPSVYSFSSIAATASGQITLTLNGGLDGADVMHINALALTAVPEPSAAGFLLGMGALYLVGLRRPRRSSAA